MTHNWGTFTPAQKDAAARIFDATSTLDNISAEAQHRIGFSELYAYANDPDRPPSPGLKEALSSDESLRADLTRLLDRVAVYHFPRLAAASTGSIDQRHGDGFQITLRPSRADPAQVYIMIELADPHATPPRALFVSDGGGRFAREALPDPQDGTIQILSEAGSDLVAALRDNRAEVFLR